MTFFKGARRRLSRAADALLGREAHPGSPGQAVSGAQVTDHVPPSAIEQEILTAIARIEARLDERNFIEMAIRGRIAEITWRLAEAQDGVARLDKRFPDMHGKLTGTREGMSKAFEELATIRRRLLEIERRLPRQPIRGPGTAHDMDGLNDLFAALDSARFLKREMPNVPFFPSKDQLLEFCVQEAGYPPVILEFGVYSGATITTLANASPPTTRLFGFDSFEGLPEDWRPGYERGMFALETLPEVPENVTLVKGWFTDSLPGFIETLDAPLQLVHVDCDLYSSTKFVLEALRNHLDNHAILIFDEYLNYDGWEEHEYKAFQEFVNDSPFDFDYIGCVPSHQQVAVRLKPRD